MEVAFRSSGRRLFGGFDVGFKGVAARFSNGVGDVNFI